MLVQSLEWSMRQVLVMFVVFSLTLLQCGEAWHSTAEVYALRFFQVHLLPRMHKGVNILDVGGSDINGSFRSALRKAKGWNTEEFVNITVVDISSSPGVDVVLDSKQKVFQLPFLDGTFDAVVTTSCFEHDRFFWNTFVEMVRVVKPGSGVIYLNAPSNGQYHAYPYDYWRFYPDAAIALAEWAAFSGYPVDLCQSFIGAGNVLHDFVAVYYRGANTCSSNGSLRVEPHIEGLSPAAHCKCSDCGRFPDPPQGPFFER